MAEPLSKNMLPGPKMTPLCCLATWIAHKSIRSTVAGGFNFNISLRLLAMIISDTNMAWLDNEFVYKCPIIFMRVDVITKINSEVFSEGT